MDTNNNNTQYNFFSKRDFVKIICISIAVSGILGLSSCVNKTKTEITASHTENENWLK